MGDSGGGGGGERILCGGAVLMVMKSVLFSVLPFCDFEIMFFGYTRSGHPFGLVSCRSFASAVVVP